MYIPCASSHSAIYGYITAHIMQAYLHPYLRMQISNHKLQLSCLGLLAVGMFLTATSMLLVQVADFLFGTAALPHDFLHEPLLRILATGFAGASTAAASLNVTHPA